MPALFKNDIRYWRRKRGLTQEELARRIMATGKCRLRQQAVSDLETGRALPAEAELEALCEALGVRRADLYRAGILDLIADASRQQ